MLEFTSLYRRQISSYLAQSNVVVLHFTLLYSISEQFLLLLLGELKVFFRLKMPMYGNKKKDHRCNS